ncbi:MAG TPA: succinyl-diaminopimelate desuccinylase [Gammaproteobacteria bacterium]|nr:succinyl-diaminopimelate desuccinylase [Gammaproteobacteria bacterium]
MADEVFELACALIARPSVTPQDAGCLDLLGARLARCGFTLERLDAGGVSNLWATRGSGGPVFCFAGHTDVVPPGDTASWRSDPYTPTVRDGRLYGRGAADMKSSLAAMIVALERIAPAAQRGTLAVLFTSDEEGLALHGTRHVVDALRARGQALDYCLVGEPSSRARLGDLLRNGRRGSLNGRLRVRGVQGHVAYPDKACNPIHRALPALEELCASVWDGGNACFPATSFQISNLQAGTGAENVIPPTLEAWFNFRYSTASTAAGLQARVHEVLDRHGLDYALDWQLSGEPFLTAGGRLLEAAQATLAAELSIAPELSTGGGTSDGRFIAPLGAEVIELGPVNETIHKVDECVAVADLEPLARVYEGIARRVLAA